MLEKPRRLVIKLGTNVVIENDADTPHLPRMKAISQDIATLHRQGCEIVIVSSGAVGMGREVLHGKIGKSLIDKQVCATIGQPILMALWASLLSEYHLTVAQLLLTARDFERRDSYLNLQQTIEQILSMGGIPIINENDATSVDEICENQQLSFGDNDRLSALVASRIGAQALVMLTKTDGIYTDNPDLSPNAQQIRLIDSTDKFKGISANGSSSKGRGGMAAKLEAAKTAILCGVQVHISSGFSPSPVLRTLNDQAGTIILPQRSVPLRKGWIGHSSGYRGVVIINEGAKQALLLNGSSLLPVGITSVRGEFSRYDVVQVEDEIGEIIGRGLTAFSSSELNRCKGLKSSEVAAVLGIDSKSRFEVEAVHRDNLVLFLGETNV